MGGEGPKWDIFGSDNVKVWMGARPGYEAVFLNPTIDQQ